LAAVVEGVQAMVEEAATANARRIERRLILSGTG
jgi:hypothetical protein